MTSSKNLGLAVACCAALLLPLLFAAPVRADGKMVVIVLYFDNNSTKPEYDVLQKGLADMLVTDLSGVEELQVVEREKLQKLIKELKLQRSKFFDPATAQKLGAGMGAKFAITGSLLALDPDMRIDIRLIEVATGKVIMADKATGSADKFFNLEQQLATKFIDGLHLKLAQAPRSGVTSVDTLLKYSRGIDAADNGDLQSASRQLAQVAKEAPEFKLAETKYQEILQRIAAAQKQRIAGLTDLDQNLLSAADAALAVSYKTSSKETSQRYFWYRLARGEVLLARIKEAASLSLPVRVEKVVPRAKWPTVIPWLKEYADNQLKYIKEQEECKAVRKDDGCRAETADKFDQERLGKLQDDQSRLDINAFNFQDLFKTKEALASLIVLGQNTMLAPTVITPLRPSLSLAEPSYAAVAMKLMDEAVAELPKVPDAGGNQQEFEYKVLSILDNSAEILLFLGRKTEAIARWQMILDRFPTSSQFATIKQKIEQALGKTKEMEAVLALEKECTDPLLVGHAGDLGVVMSLQVPWAEGPRGMASMLDALLTSCKKAVAGNYVLMTYYQFAAAAAVARSDCDLVVEIRRKVGAYEFATYATSVGIQLKDQLDALEPACGPFKPLVLKTGAASAVPGTPAAGEAKKGHGCGCSVGARPAPAREGWMFLLLLAAGIAAARRRST